MHLIYLTVQRSYSATVLQCNGPTGRRPILKPKMRCKGNTFLRHVQIFGEENFIFLTRKVINNFRKLSKTKMQIAYLQRLAFFRKSKSYPKTESY